MAPHRPRPGPRLRRISRDTVLFSAGILGVTHETLTSGKVERPYLLAVFAGMMGPPAFLRADEKRRESKDDEQ